MTVFHSSPVKELANSHHVYIVIGQLVKLGIVEQIQAAVGGQTSHLVLYVFQCLHNVCVCIHQSEMGGGGGDVLRS